MSTGTDKPTARASCTRAALKDALAFITAALVMMLILHANVARERTPRERPLAASVRSDSSGTRQARAEADGSTLTRDSEIAKIPLVSSGIAKVKSAPESSPPSPILSGNAYDPECDFAASEQSPAATETGNEMMRCNLFTWIDSTSEERSL